MSTTTRYEAGQKTCDKCGDVFSAAVETWSGHTYIVCSKPECIAAAKAHPRNKWVLPDQIPCSAEGCPNFIPEGSYSKRVRLFVCSIACYMQRAARGTAPFTCDYCGKATLGHRTRSRSHFCNRDCHQKFLTEEGNRRAGIHQPLLEWYLATFVPIRYRGRSIPAARSVVTTFLGRMSEIGIKDLDEVTPAIISSYLRWARESNFRSAAATVSLISMFFIWMISEGSRKNPNPVISSIHCTRPPKRKPRPYSDSQIDDMWLWLRLRGTSRSRAEAAIAEEAGLRLGELTRIRLSDVDLNAQRIRVGLPNKTNTERDAFFGKKSKQYIQEWMQDRDPSCGHDMLFHNTLGHPCTEWQVAREFQTILCKTFEGKKQHEEGFDKWHMHRLRHTMASRLAKGGATAIVVMASGGWKTFDAMTGYTDVDQEDARRGYDQAMQAAVHRNRAKPSRSTLSLEQLQERLRLRA